MKYLGYCLMFFAVIKIAQYYHGPDRCPYVDPTVCTAPSALRRLIDRFWKAVETTDDEFWDNQL